MQSSHSRNEILRGVLVQSNDATFIFNPQQRATEADSTPVSTMAPLSPLLLLVFLLALLLSDSIRADDNCSGGCGGHHGLEPTKSKRVRTSGAASSSSFSTATAAATTTTTTTTAHHVDQQQVSVLLLSPHDEAAATTSTQAAADTTTSLQTDIVPPRNSSSSSSSTRDLANYAPLQEDVTAIVNVPGRADTSALSWADSYSVGADCYCATTFDHDIGSVAVRTPLGLRTVRDVCAALGPGPGRNGRPLYNTVQCGHPPYNNAGDEADCPGRTEYGIGGCRYIGPMWNFSSVRAIPITKASPMTADALWAWIANVVSGWLMRLLDGARRIIA
jgi:hypothetical protein